MISDFDHASEFWNIACNFEWVDFVVANYRTINAGVLSAKPFDFPKKFVDQGEKQGAQWARVFFWPGRQLFRVAAWNQKLRKQKNCNLTLSFKKLISKRSSNDQRAKIRKWFWLGKGLEKCSLALHPHKAEKAAEKEKKKQNVFLAACLYL